MRILHVIPSYFPAYEQGGPVVSVHTINKWLVKAGADVSVYTTNVHARGLLKDVPLNKETLVDGVRVVYFPLTWRAWEYSWNMHRALKKNIQNFDLVHITSVFLSASALGAYYANKYHKPYIISPRGSLMKEPLSMKSALLKRAYLALIEKRNLAGAAAIHFTISSEEGEYREMKLPLRRSVVIPNALELPEEAQGVDGAAFRERHRIERFAKVVLALGRINWKKGFDTLIPAFAAVAKEMPEARLVIAGDDAEGYKKTVQLLITNYKLQDKVVFTGMLAGAEKWSAIAAADVFVLPSYSENFGMAVVEAIAMGVPVVISDKVGVAADISGSAVGIVTKKEAAQISKGILEILQNLVLRNEMKIAAKVLIEKRFNPKKVAEEFLNSYAKFM